MTDPIPAHESEATPAFGGSGTETRAAKSTDLSGKTLGDYRILRRLGRGGMAEVYLAQQQSLRRQVALKVLRSQLAEDEAYVRRFHREAQAAAALVHANIVQIYEVGNADGYHYIAQEYVAGRNLRQQIQQNGPVELSMAASIIRQVAAALHKAATQGIVHRDIKPENIMLTADGEVKVADFGLARIANDADAMHLTSAGVALGTPLYMSPEQVAGGRVDCRSDIYSFGVTCYHMLTGRPPFEGQTAIAIAMKHATATPNLLVEQRENIPAPLADLIHDMLSKEPDQRPKQPVDILKRLRDIKLGDSDSWGIEIDDWSVPELLAMTRGSEATQQLQSLMQAESRLRGKDRFAWRWWIAGVAAAVVLAAVAARMNAPEDLLRYDRSQIPAIKRQETPRDQYDYAGFTPLNIERAYKAVLQYFPPEESPENAYYGRLARMRLFELYLEQNRLTEAYREASRLAAAEPTETEARAYGIAGQVLVLQRQGKTEQVEELSADLFSIAGEVPGSMRRRLSEAGFNLGSGEDD